MKYQVYFGIAIRIIILFSVGMLWTFINPQIREFLGDVPCTRTHINQWNQLVYDCQGNSSLDDAYVWQARHYWYFWMMFCLFLLSLINVIIGIIKVITKHYPELN